MRSFKIFALGGLLVIMLAGCFRVPAPPVDLANSWGERQVFDYNGVKINYYVAGQGPPVILLHGFGSGAYSWRYVAPALAADHRVFALDLKGYGLSDKPDDGKYAISDQADMVAAFIQTQDLHNLTIIGHSMGGGVTLMTYFKVRKSDPARIKKMVLIDSAGYPQEMPWFIAFAQLPVVSTVGPWIVSPRLTTIMALRKCYYYKDKITEDQIDAYTYYGSLPGAREAVVATAKEIAPDDIQAVIARYKTIKVPVLIIWGEDDEVVPLSVGKHFKRDIPDSELVILPKCGHIPPEEEAQETTRLVKAFLRK